MIFERFNLISHLKNLFNCSILITLLSGQVLALINTHRQNKRQYILVSLSDTLSSETNILVVNFHFVFYTLSLFFRRSFLVTYLVKLVNFSGTSTEPILHLFICHFRSFRRRFSAIFVGFQFRFCTINCINSICIVPHFFQTI